VNPQQFNTDEARWKAVSENNADADGVFYYAVRTTGIYCRPSCTAKLPNRNNVEYFAACGDAEKAGYRACRRCRPTSASKGEEAAQKIVHACRIIEERETVLKLDELAARVGLSPYHFHRLFKKMVGVTPRQYAARQQSRRFRDSLESGSSVTDAIYAAGYGSSGSAYDKRRNQLAMPPSVYRGGAAGVTITWGIARCFLGWVIVAATERGICAIMFADEPEVLPGLVQQRFPRARLHEADKGFATLLTEVVDFIEEPKGAFQLPLDIQGTAFQQQVWEALRQVKPGETLSYTEVAERIGKPRAVRAVASACAANKLAVVIPCHRVLTKGGNLGGYRWGSERKRRLLEAEQEQCSP